MTAKVLLASAILFTATLVALASPAGVRAASLFGTTAQPATQNLPVQDGRSGSGPFSYELGMKFTVSEAQRLTALRFYKDPLETGLHTGRIWSAGGGLLASVDFAAETASGWQEQALAAPLDLVPGTVYVASVNVNAFFGLTPLGLASPVVNGALSTVADAQNGVFGSAAGLFPNQTFNSPNYFVDVVVAGLPPTVTSTTPAADATAVATSGAVSATFSRSMDAATITSSSFTLTGPAGAVTATVAYDAATNTATLTPGAPLAVGTVYTARVDTAVKASDGTALASAVSWSFTTVPAPPTVTSTLPAADATGVATNVAVTAAFSRAMNATTITSSSFTLTGPGGGVATSVAYDAATNTATLRPAAVLAAGTTYVARLDASVKAGDGTPLAANVSWSFTTVSSAPTVTGRSPAADATGVNAGTSVTASFSRAMDGSSLTSSSFTLSGPAGPVSALVTYDSAARSATLAPSLPLANGATYTARLDTTVKAADGVALAGSVSWSFTTSAAPTVVSETPADGSTVSDDVLSVRATFSRAMDPATMSNTSVRITGPNGLEELGFAYDDATKTLTLSRSLGLRYGGSYTVTLDASIRAADGVPLAAPVSWSFTTASAVSATAPASGATNVAASSTVSATFSRPMAGSSIGSSSFTLTGPGGAVPAAVVYDATARIATLTPAAPLAPGTAYTATLDKHIASATGVEMAASVSWSFTTAPASPATGPTVTGRTPASGAARVATTTSVKAVFSAAMDPASISTSSFTLTRVGDGTVPASVTYDAATQTATLKPTAPLAYSASYTATVGTAAKASDGTALATAASWTFTTVDATRINAGDGTYTSSTGQVFSGDSFASGGSLYSTSADISGTPDPRLYQNERWGQFSYAVPVQNGVYDVRIYFAELYYAAPCAGKRVFGIDVLDTSVSPDLANVDICAAVGANAALIRTVSGVQVTDGVLNLKAVYGSADDPELTAFEVIPAGSLPSGPYVTRATPTTTNAPTTTKVTAVFSQAMDPATLTSASFTLAPSGGTPVPATVSYNSTTNTATLTPGATLTYATSYTATLTTGVKAASGAALPSQKTWSFTTADGTRINSGDGAYTTQTGTTFAGDSLFSGGSIYSTSAAISGTDDSTLYQNERWGQFAYAIPVANSTYTVRLHFVELYYAAPCAGQRVFGIDIVDTPASPDIADLDICALVGPNAALVRTVTGVRVSDGVLNVKSVYGSVDDPELAAIEVLPG